MRQSALPSQKAPSARWRTTPKAKGLARIGQGPTGIQLRLGSHVLIHVAPAMAYPGRTITGWYWYGLGQNTSGSACETLEQAKAEATAYYKANSPADDAKPKG